MKVRILLVTALLSIGVLPAAAQSVKLSFHGGKVDLVAENATVRAILTEWARVGSTRIVNAERLVGPPVTVEFKDAYEQRVLEALLRNVSGYIVGPRPIAGASNASGFDRIVILPTSTAPGASPVTPAVSRPPGPQPIRRLPMPIDDAADDTVDDIDPAVANGPGAGAAGNACRPAPPSRSDSRSRARRRRCRTGGAAHHAGQPLRRHHRSGAAGRDHAGARGASGHAPRACPGRRSR